MAAAMAIHRLRIAALWANEWVWESLSGRVGARPCAGLDMLDGAMAMAAYNRRKGPMLKLLALGASHEAFRWAPFRAAASWGDASLMRALAEASMPSEQAFEEARGRALRDGPAEMLDELAAVRARQEMREIRASLHARDGEQASSPTDGLPEGAGGARRL